MTKSSNFSRNQLGKQEDPNFLAQESPKPRSPRKATEKISQQLFPVSNQFEVAGMKRGGTEQWKKYSSKTPEGQREKNERWASSCLSPCLPCSRFCPPLPDPSLPSRLSSLCLCLVRANAFLLAELSIARQVRSFCHQFGKRNGASSSPLSREPPLLPRRGKLVMP